MFKELAKSIIIYGLAGSLGRFINLFLVPIYTRIFTPADYGIIDLIATVIGVAPIFCMLQLESAIQRYFYEIKDEDKKKQMISSILWTIIVLSIVAVMIICFFAPVISRLLCGSGNVSKFIIIASFGIPFTSIFSLFNVVIRFLKQPVFFLIVVTVQLLLSVGLSIVLVVYMRTGISGVFIAQIIGSASACILLTVKINKYLSFTWSKSIVAMMLKYSLPLVPSVGGNYLNSYANRIVMVSYLSVADVGLYSVALRFASVFGLINNAFSMAWGPVFWETLERPDHREIYKKMSQYVTYLILFLVILISIFAKEIIQLFTTKDYSGAANLIGMLSLSTGLTIICQTVGMGASIRKKTIFNTYIYFISVAVNIGSLFILVPHYGLVCVPVCMVLSSLALVASAWYTSEKLYYIGFNKLSFILSVSITGIILSLLIFFDIHFIFKIIFTLIILAVSLYLVKNKLKTLFSLKK